jgi:TRAP-type C4-dicarboxylate transport system permease small subunit
LIIVLEKLSSKLNRLVEQSLFVLGFSMAAIVAAEVFSRYVLNHSIFWSEELARYLLVWLTFLGASVAYRRHAHATVDVIYRRLPHLAKAASALLVHICSLLFFGVMVVYGWQFSLFVRLQISPALHLPKWIPHAVLPLSGLILFVHALTFLIKDLERFRRDR